MPIADNPIVTGEIAVAVVFLQPQCNMTCTSCVTEDDFEPLRFEDAMDLLGHLVQRGVRSVVLGPAREQVPSLDGSRRRWRRCSSSTYPEDAVSSSRLAGEGGVPAMGQRWAKTDGSGRRVTRQLVGLTSQAAAWLPGTCSGGREGGHPALLLELDPGPRSAISVTERVLVGPREE